MSRLNVGTESFEFSVVEYYKAGGRDGTHLRLGQYLWNQWGAGSKSWPELFYETDDAKVLELARADVYEEY
jgi:hypothetical protein